MFRAIKEIFRFPVRIVRTIDRIKEIHIWNTNHMKHHAQEYDPCLYRTEGKVDAMMAHWNIPIPDEFKKKE